MKKLILAGAALILAAGAFAQQQVVKDAEQLFKKAGSYAEYLQAVEAIKPAFTNPETAQQAQTYFIPAKYGFALYDQYYLARTLGDDDPNHIKDAATLLMESYNYGMKALPLDSLPDERGKIKPKYSKDIINVVKGHFNDFDRVAVDNFTLGNYAGAYDAWEALLDMATDPRYNKGIESQFTDAVIANIRANQGAAAINAQDYPRALSALERAIAIGVENPDIFRRCIGVAEMLQDKEGAIKYSLMGMEKFGSDDPTFLREAVNNMIDLGQLDRATALLDNAIATDPNNAAYQYSYGVLLAKENKYDEAKAAYRKSIELNPEEARTYYDLGRVLAEQNDALDNACELQDAAYAQFQQQTLFPLLRESAEAFEKAYALDEDRYENALHYLKNIYYVLHDHDNLARVCTLLGEPME